MKRLADRLGQQVAHDARQDDDGTGQGRDAAKEVLKTDDKLYAEIEAAVKARLEKGKK